MMGFSLLLAREVLRRLMFSSGGYIFSVMKGLSSVLYMLLLGHDETSRWRLKFLGFNLLFLNVLAIWFGDNNKILEDLIIMASLRTGWIFSVGRRGEPSMNGIGGCGRALIGVSCWKLIMVLDCSVGGSDQTQRDRSRELAQSSRCTCFWPGEIRSSCVSVMWVGKMTSVSGRI